MGTYDDEVYDDDEYYDDDEEYDDDDEQMGLGSSGGRNPFATGGGSGLPGRDRFGQSRVDADDAAADRGRVFGSRSNDDDSGSSRFGSGNSSSSSSSRFGDKKDDDKSGSSRFGGGSGSSGGSSRFGGGSSSSSSSSRFGDKKDDDKSGSSRFGSGGSGSSSGSSRFGGGSSSSSPSRFGDKKEDDKGKKDYSSGKSRFGGGGKKDDKDKKNDDKKSGGGRFGGRFGGGDKKDADAKKDDGKKPSGGRFGDGKKNDKGAADKKDGDDSGGGIGAAIGGAFGGIAGRFGGGKKDDGSDKSKSGGRSFGRFRGGGKKDDKADDKGAAAASTDTKGGRFGAAKKQSAFGKSTASGKDDKQRPGKAKDKAAAGDGVSFMQKMRERLPFGHRAKDARKSKTRASKVPKAKEGEGLSLDDKLDIVGVVLVFGALVLFISSLSGEQGSLTEKINTFFGQLLGWGALAMPLAVGGVGLWLIFRHFGDEAPEIDPVRISGLIIGYVGLLAGLMIAETFVNPVYSDPIQMEWLPNVVERFTVDRARGGGWVGGQLYLFMVVNIGEIPAFFVVAGWLVISLMLITRTTAAELAVFIISIYRSFGVAVQRSAQKRRAERLALQEAKAKAQAEQVKISAPQPEALPAAQQANALPQPEGVPIEQRGIPIRIGGQQLENVNAEAQSGSAAPPPAAMPETPAATTVSKENDSSGLFGGISRALPFGGRSSNTEKPAASNPPPRAKEKDSSSLLGGISRALPFGGRSNGDDAKETKEKAPATAPEKPAAQTSTPAATTPPPAPVTPIADDEDDGQDDESMFAKSNTPRRDPFAARDNTTAASIPANPVQQPQPEDAVAKSTAFTPKPSDAQQQPAAEAKQKDRFSRLDEIRSGLGNAEKVEEPKPAVQTEPEKEKASPFKKPEFDANGAPHHDKGFTPPTSSAGKPAAPSVENNLPQPKVHERVPAINPDDHKAEGKGTIKPAAQAVAARRGAKKEWRLPDYRTLLASGSEGEFDRDQLVQRARIIEETLSAFGAPGKVVEINTGPVITQFGVEPDYLMARGGKKNRVKVNAIAQLDKDLQLALGAKSIRIEAPVPGKGFVGIEVPNAEPSLVSLRDVMESKQFQKIGEKSPLAIALGQSVDGAPVSADLASMPHLLIAGTTGSGKSVCVNAIINSIIVRNSPDVVKFIMVDPKRVELTGYNGIPHLVAPVVVELERIVGVLKWVTREMDERYKKFSTAGARNIEDYNKHRPANEPNMPYIVVIIDELADLMMLAPDETERVITRIAALARATGIHLVIATQRPSVDVVTGLIKANFPARNVCSVRVTCST